MKRSTKIARQTTTLFALAILFSACTDKLSQVDEDLETETSIESSEPASESEENTEQQDLDQDDAAQESDGMDGLEPDTLEDDLPEATTDEGSSDLEDDKKSETLGDAAEKATPSSSASYTVELGDSLGEIAKSQLGDASRWKEIATLNELEDPNVLTVGMTLMLPASNGEAVETSDADSKTNDNLEEASDSSDDQSVEDDSLEEGDDNSIE